MLSAWENRRPHKARFNSRFQRMKLKINRWVIYQLGSGDPNKNMFILTSKLRHIPLISLRNDEYIDFLSEQQYVGKNWNEFWQEPQKGPKLKRLPLKEVKNNTNIKQLSKRNGINKEKQFTIYIDRDDKENDKTVIRRVPFNKQNLNSFRIINDGDICSLDSFERDLLAEGTSETGNNSPLLFWEQRKSVRQIKTPVYVSTRKLLSENKSKTPITELFNFENKPEPKIEIVNESSTKQLTLSNDFEFDSIPKDKPTAKYFKESTKYQALGFDGDRVAVQKEIRATGLKGWIANKVRPETRSTFDNRLTLDSHPVISQTRNLLIPLIQRSEFFSRGNMISRDSRNHFSRHKPKEFKTLEEARKFQVSQYSRNKIPVKSRGNPSYKDSLLVKSRISEFDQEMMNDKLEKIEKIVSTTKGIITNTDLTQSVTNNRLVEDLVVKLNAQRAELQQRITVPTETINLKPNLTKTQSRWRIFSGLRHGKNSQNTEKPVEPQVHVTSVKPASVKLETPQPPTIRIFESPEVREAEAEAEYEAAENCAMNNTLQYSTINDVYDFFASYEDTTP